MLLEIGLSDLGYSVGSMTAMAVFPELGGVEDDDVLARAASISCSLAWLEAEHGVTGAVSGTEVGDEESHYEIEVMLEDGRHVDVQLTEDFEVVGLD